MDLPVRFPSEAEVILDDIASFRALTTAERLGCLRGMVDAGASMMRRSPRAAWLEADAAEQERLARRNVREFLGRHGY